MYFSTKKVDIPLRGCVTLSWWRCLCAAMIRKAMPAEISVPGKVSLARQVHGQVNGQTKSAPGQAGLIS